MTFSVVFRPSAEADLDNLYNYIAEHSSIARAGDFTTRINAACMALAQFPRRGAPRDDLKPGLRTLAFDGRVVIAYEIDHQTVRILRVFYAGRNYESEFADN